MHIKAVAFDLDHTLYDRDGMDAEAAVMFCGKYPELISDRARFETEFVDCVHEGIWKGWSEVDRILKSRGILSERTDPHLIWKTVTSWYLDHMKPLPFTDKLLHALRLRGMKLGMITNGPLDVQTRKVKALRLDEMLDEILVGHDPATAKPNACIFHEMAHRLGVLPGEMLFCGDNPVNDVCASENAGCRAVWIRTIDRWPAELAEPALSALTCEEIPAIVDRINAQG